MVLSSWQSHCESSPGSFDECRTAPSGHRPKTKPDDLGCESACTGCQSLHLPSPFIITQPESWAWYSFYRPTKGRRLSRPSWLVTYRDGLPVHRRSPILVLTGSDVAQLRWSRPTRYLPLSQTANQLRSWIDGYGAGNGIMSYSPGGNTLQRVSEQSLLCRAPVGYLSILLVNSRLLISNSLTTLYTLCLYRLYAAETITFSLRLYRCPVTTAEASYDGAQS